jgi:hypothetical protein
LQSVANGSFQIQVLNSVVERPPKQEFQRKVVNFALVGLFKDLSRLTPLLARAR